MATGSPQNCTGVNACILKHNAELSRLSALGKSLKGYIDKGLVEVHNIKKRHEALAKEMKRRGMNHQSPLEDVSLYVSGKVDIETNIKELKRRCQDCLSRMNDICL